MHQIQPFNFDGSQVRVVERDGEALFVARDVASALGYARPSKAVQDHCKGVLKQDIPSAGGVQAHSVIREPDVYRLIVKSNLPSAERFEAWVFEEVLPTIRKTGGYQASGTESASVPATMALCELAINVLRPSDSSKIVMLRKAGNALGADTSFLPDYAEDSAPGHVGAMDTASATQLLREYGVPMSAAKFNVVLESIGLIERRRRPTKAGTKHFWCITEDGLAYGKNVVSPQSQRETQPHWYRARFTDLLELIGWDKWRAS